ncbi:TadE/TadG family type IV pilus assembly protein [Streptomyces sp. NPDC048603]|uniref:TadE/TadG family type IV pilus assembly protein n=1 Tax=Streptomyces sp. NPDC048603 TaxID=3365577 RepID=UPI003720BD56
MAPQGPTPANADHAKSPRQARARDRGQVALEYIGFLPILLLVGLAGIQLGWTAYCEQQAETAARTAARVAARTDENPEAAGIAAGQAAVRESIRGATEVNVSAGDDVTTATVRITVRSIIPGLDIERRERTAIMPSDRKRT